MSHPVILADECIGCGICIDACPQGTIEVVDGALNGMVGKVSEVNTENGTLTAVLEMFGRETPVELEFAQVRKVNR